MYKVEKLKMGVVFAYLDIENKFGAILEIAQLF